MLRAVPAALPAQSLLPDWLGCWSPWVVARFAGWPLRWLCAMGQAGRVASWLLGPSELLSMGFGEDAADPFTSTGHQLFTAVSSGHSDPKLQGSLWGRRKIIQQLLVRGMVTQQDHDWSPLAFPGC